MPAAMPGAMLAGCSEQTTQRNATDERNVRLQDSPKSSSVPDPRKPVDNGKWAVDGGRYACIKQNPAEVEQTLYEQIGVAS